MRLGTDHNWWVEETSDPVHWDPDGLGIIDPRQMGHVFDALDPLRDYGFEDEVLDNAFYTFRIERELSEGRVRVIRTYESLSESTEPLFALPDVLNEEKGPYADFLDAITRSRVKLLNDQIDFEQKLTVDEIEEEIRERQQTDFIEGRASHFFNEINGILEYVPEGFEADGEDAEEAEGELEEEALEDFPDLEEGEEKLVEDETMRWDEEEAAGALDDQEDEEDEDGEEALGEDDDEDEEEDDDEDEEEEEAEGGDEDAPRGRRR